MSEAKDADVDRLKGRARRGYREIAGSVLYFQKSPLRVRAWWHLPLRCLLGEHDFHYDGIEAKPAGTLTVFICQRCGANLRSYWQ